ncbi:MAG: hypothetical protein JJE47_02240 [Acidimicrobiia bacterium]|nr:hypothetical protein [Acidimicrobiia bacterium]
MTLDPEERRARARRWVAVALATVLMVMDFILFVFGFATGRGEETILAGGIIGIGLGLVPGVFVVAALVSQHPRGFRAAALATVLWGVVAAPISIVNLPVALVAGFGAGGVVAFRRDEVHSLLSRVVAVMICALYTLVVQRISPAAGILAGAPLPFLAIAMVDAMRVRRADKTNTPAV